MLGTYTTIIRFLSYSCLSPPRILEGTFVPPTTGKAADFVEAYFDKVPEEAFDRVLRVNAFGPYWLTFAFLPLLEKWKEHGVLDIGSSSSWV